jgi:hypothetical protein
MRAVSMRKPLSVAAACVCILVGASLHLLISCGGGPGGSSKSPSVSASVSPREIAAGDNALLTWSAAGADRVEISEIPEATSPSGSIVVSPSRTTAYSVTAYWPTGEIRTAVATVTVIEVDVPDPPPPPPPEVLAVSIEVSWELPTRYADGSAIHPDNQALLVVRVYMSDRADGFDNTSIPVATSDPGSSSVTFGPVDVTAGVEYFFACRSELAGQVSGFSPAYGHVWP